MTEGFSDMRQELNESSSADHNALLRWSLVFWTAQVVVLVALLRILRQRSRFLFSERALQSLSASGG